MTDVEKDAPTNLLEIPHTPLVKLTGSTRFAIKAIAIIAVCTVLYFGQSFFLPVVLAAIIALTFSPIIKFGKKLKLPAAFTAALMILGFAGTVATAITTLSEPFSELVADAPQIGSKIQLRLETILEPVKSLNDASEQVEKIANGGDSNTAQEVIVMQPGLIARAADDVVQIAASIILTLVLAFFLMISRDMIFRKIVRVLPTLADKKKALHVANDIERDVSRYLLTVTAINSGLGVLIATSFWLLGMANPILWGAIAALLNFLPYVGSLVGIVAATGVALISFPVVGQALTIPLCYIILTALEGQFVTPLILGRRFSLNTVVILLAIAFWGFIWGAIGVLIAVPILIIFKSFCERIESLSSFGEFLSGDDVAEDVITNLKQN